MAGEGRRLKWINNKDFLSISSRIDAGEQHKDAENSLQADSISSPSRALGAGGVGSTRRKGMDHTSTWGSRSCWRDSIHQNRADQLGSITCVPRDTIGPMFSLVAFSHPSASGRVIPWWVLLLRTGYWCCSLRPAIPCRRGRGQGKAEAHPLLPLWAPCALTADPRGGCYKTPPGTSHLRLLTGVSPCPSCQSPGFPACRGQVSSCPSALL